MARFIDVSDLDKEDAELIEKIVERLRKALPRAEKKSASDILQKTAGAWAHTADCEELKRRIYEGRRSVENPEE
jgi:hypothetical protein